MKFPGKGQDFTTLLGGGLAVFLFVGAAAQEGYYGVGHDKWHQNFYSKLKRNDGQGSCCNLMDCRPTQRSFTAGLESRRDALTAFQLERARIDRAACDDLMLREYRPANPNQAAWDAALALAEHTTASGHLLRDHDAAVIGMGESEPFPVLYEYRVV